MEKKLVIFDLDGTLFQTHLTSVQAAQRALSDCRLPQLDTEVITSFFGETMDVFCSGIAPDADAKTKNELADKIRSYERILIAERGKLYEGVGELLGTLKQEGFTLAICSNGSRNYVQTVLAACKISEYFKHIKSRDSASNKSEMIHDLLHEVQPALAVAVGDRRHDFYAARENRIPSIGVGYGYGGEETNHADYKISKVNDIISIIKKCEIFKDIEGKIQAFCGVTPFVIGVNGVVYTGFKCISDKQGL
jgi:phosphoglycolate phosphatase